MHVQHTAQHMAGLETSRQFMGTSPSGFAECLLTQQDTVLAVKFVQRRHHWFGCTPLMLKLRNISAQPLRA